MREWIKIKKHSNNNNNNNNFIYPRYYFTIKIEYLQKKQLSDLPIGRAHANI